jgi:hypothetical protein
MEMVGNIGRSIGEISNIFEIASKIPLLKEIIEKDLHV